MTANVPETVACPCGGGYANRRPTVIRERDSMGRLQITHVYKHKGCPIGGHIVTVSGYVERRSGPLFTATSREIKRLLGDTTTPVRVATDGGEPT